jgi:hypothetical protein
MAAAAIAAILLLPQNGSPARSLLFQRGVNFTAEGRAGYTPEVARPMLLKLRVYGVNSIALVPYAFSAPDRPMVRFGGGWEREENIASVAAAARELGFKVLLKPQVWMRGSFTGDLYFERAEDRAEWFRQYEQYLIAQAKLATRIRADLFCVGVEFVKLSRDESQWRRLIALARKHYRGPITYAATQGAEFEDLRFWDAVDYIGLNQYYPLTAEYSAAEIAARVEQVARRWKKPVIITETGFSSYESPHLAPWDETPRQVAPADQARAYEAVFRAFYGKPWLHGIYWWKVGTNGYGGPQDGSHTPWGKPAMEVVKRWYLNGRR